MCFESLVVYECEGNPEAAEWVFDYPVTNEHRFYESVEFRKIKIIDIVDLSKHFKKFSFATLQDCKNNLEIIRKCQSTKQL